jgi:hypothetical protein
MNDTKRLTPSDLARATPVTRDRYADFLRAFSIGVVVLGHWLLAVVTLRNGHFGGTNALELVPGLWALTWVLQVMPIFFFVGGFSNAASWRSGKTGSYGQWLRARIARLVAPTIVFAGTWTILALVLRAVVGTPDQGVAAGLALLAIPLWFLGVYVVVVAVAPAMHALHRRFGVRALLAMGVGAALVDLLRLTIAPPVGLLNFAIVWLFAHQVGFFYEDGSLVRLGRRAHLALAAAGLAAVAILVGSGVYAPSMVGIETVKASNNSPPSIVLVALTVWLVGLAMIARPRVSTWLGDVRPWTLVIVANARIMTLFLWHMTALFVVAVTTLPLGFPQPRAGSGAWWASRPLWIAVLAGALAVLVAIFGRFERPARAYAPPPGRARAIVGIGLLCAALVGITTKGFAEPGWAVLSLTGLAGGSRLLRVPFSVSLHG